jgi:tetratricopeptide (TPR) repeat protein
MRRHYAALVLLLAVSVLPAMTQTEQPAPPAAPSQAAQAVDPSEEAPQAAQVPAQPKLDALLIYRQGRDLETAGRQADAQAKFALAVSVCDQELSADSKRLEAFVVKCWCLFRLNRYTEVISTGQAGMRVAFDARISEVMGESYYFLGQMENCLKSLQKYVEVSGDSGDRGPTAYFFMGEAYLRLKKYSHADMAYSTAVLKEPSMPRWWFRLGNACEASGDWKRALDAYNKALALSPAFPEAVSAQARVKAQAAP